MSYKLVAPTKRQMFAKHKGLEEEEEHSSFAVVSRTPDLLKDLPCGGNAV